MKLKRLLLIAAPIALLGGLTSCIASEVLPNPSPNNDGSISSGMDEWKKIKESYQYQGKPEWCLSQHVLGDGEYSELNCYLPTGKVGNKYSYKIVHCIFDTPDFPSRCDEPSRTETFSEYEKGKWMRFYGNLSPTTTEVKLIELKQWSLQIGVLLIFLAAPLLGAMWALWSILSNNWKP
jgi:hypothetical protein